MDRVCVGIVLQNTLHGQSMCRNSPTKCTTWTECVGIVLQNTLHGQSMCRNSPTKYTTWTEYV